MHEEEHQQYTEMQGVAPLARSWASGPHHTLNILDWDPTGDFGDGYGDERSRLSGWGLLSFNGIDLHLEAWEIELVAAPEYYRAKNSDLRDDLDALQGAVMQDSAFQMAQVQFPDETTPRLYVVFAWPHGT